MNEDGQLKSLVRAFLPSSWRMMVFRQRQRFVESCNELKRRASDFFPDRYIQVSQFRERFGRDPNLETPATFNEKIHWLMLHYRLSEMTRLANKYEVRTHGAVRESEGSWYPKGGLGRFHPEEYALEVGRAVTLPGPVNASFTSRVWSEMAWRTQPAEFIATTRARKGQEAIMNNTVYYDRMFPDDRRRELLFDGQLFVYSPRPSSRAFVEFARTLIEEAFAPLNPETAQYEMPVERYADVLIKLKPGFIHHPESKRFIQNLFVELGCDLEKTYFDVPKMRSSTSDNYLTTGIAYAWHPHRDTWYSAPSCQVNWWIPIYDIQADNAMAFHPRYWNRPVKNSSKGYNYYLWNQQNRGAHVAKFLKEDPRPLPKPTEPLDLDPQIRLIVPAGGIIMFSGSQMHSSVPNTSGKTRFSIDFRVVHEDDVSQKKGAPSVDEECTGTTMRDYLRGTDFSHIPDNLVALYDDGTGMEGELVFKPQEPGT